MTSDDLMSYDKIKQFLLTEFRLTPKEYKVRFDTASKNVNETYVLFTSRLGNLLLCVPVCRSPVLQLPEPTQWRY